VSAAAPTTQRSHGKCGNDMLAASVSSCRLTKLPSLTCTRLSWTVTVIAYFIGLLEVAKLWLNVTTQLSDWRGALPPSPDCSPNGDGTPIHDPRILSGSLSACRASILVPSAGDWPR